MFKMVKSNICTRYITVEYLMMSSNQENTLQEFMYRKFNRNNNRNDNRKII